MKKLISNREEMHINKGNIVIVILSFPLAALITLVSCIALFNPGFYGAETLNWQTQALGQDMIDLLVVVPALLLTPFFSDRKYSTVSLIWAGIILYIIYTFMIYCFSVHFNMLFPLYCAILGLSFYYFLWFILSIIKKPVLGKIYYGTATRITGIYFVVISLVFYFLWLSEIISSIMRGAQPESLVKTNLFTNPVHVIDLAFFLPGLFLSGLFILRRNRLSHVLTIVMLTFFIIMNITIGWLAFLLKKRGLETSGLVTIIMTGLALISFITLVWNTKKNRMGVKSLSIQSKA